MLDINALVLVSNYKIFSIMDKFNNILLIKKIKTEKKGLGTLKTLLLSFVVLSQIAIFVLTQLYLQHYFVWLAVVSVILSLCTCIFVLTNDKNSESKPVWILFIITCPTLGFIVYFISSEEVFFRKKGKAYSKILTDSYKYLREEKIASEDRDFNNACNYLKNSGNFIPYTNTQSTYFSCGAEYFDDAIKQMQNAKEFIFIEFFIISNGTLLNKVIKVLEEKAKHGVDVRIIYDDLGCYSTLSNRKISQIKKMGIKICPFNKMLSRFSAFLNYRDHRKYIIIDGKVGYSGGINLADEYVGEKKLHGFWKDSGLKIEGPAVDGFTLAFLRQWSFVSRKDTNYALYLNKAQKFSNNSIIVPFNDGLEYSDNIGKNTYANIIADAKEKLLIFTPYLVIDDTITDLLITKAKSGVKVKIVLPQVCDKRFVYIITRSNAEKLFKNGVDIYFMNNSFVHSKIVLNENYGAISSINLDLRSFYQQFENGVLLNDYNTLQEIEKDFEYCIKNSTKLDNNTMLSKSFVFKIWAMILNLFSPFM